MDNEKQYYCESGRALKWWRGKRPQGLKKDVFALAYPNDTIKERKRKRANFEMGLNSFDRVVAKGRRSSAKFDKVIYDSIEIVRARKIEKSEI